MLGRLIKLKRIFGAWSKVVDSSSNFRETKNNEKKVVFALKTSSWKHHLLMACYPEFSWVFIKNKDRIADFHDLISEFKDLSVCIWGTGEPSEDLEYIKANGLDLWRMEDGFLRSVGLGCLRAMPNTLVIDKSGGIYFDPSSEKGLETLIVSSKLTDGEYLEAEALLDLIRSVNLTKYNVRDSELEKDFFGTHYPKLRGKHKVLVIGQVEDDASIKLGGLGYDNGMLVRKAKELYPESEVLFRPHPDVQAGKRDIKTPLSEISKIALVVDDRMSLSEAIDNVDEVFVISSLVGFEALLRGVSVTVAGHPFYAGWGLTNDLTKFPRRNDQIGKLPACKEKRILHILHAAYVQYPDYLDVKNFKRCSVLDTVNSLRADLGR